MTGAVPDRRQDERAMFTSAEPAEVCPHGHRHLPPALDRRCWPAVSPVPGQQREAVARWLFAHDGNTPSAWDRLLNDRGKRVWLAWADELLALLATTRDGEQA